MVVVPETAVAMQQYSDSNKMVTTGGKTIGSNSNNQLACVVVQRH